MPIIQNNLWSGPSKIGTSDVVMYISHASGTMMHTFAYPYTAPMSKCRSWIEKYGDKFATESTIGRKDGGKDLNQIFGADASDVRYVRRAYSAEASDSTASIKFHSMLKPGKYRLNYSALGSTGNGGQNELSFFYTDIKEKEYLIVRRNDEFGWDDYTADFNTEFPIRSMRVYVRNSRFITATTAEIQINKAYLTNP